MRKLSLLFVSLLAALLTGAAAAASPDPAYYFTANWPMPDAAPVTAVEAALLDRINGATVSIDAAIYDFNRSSLRDALLAAKGRGVTIRVVTDDEARVSTASKPF